MRGPAPQPGAASARRRAAAHTAALATLALGAPAQDAAAPGHDRRPNVLIVLADDLGSGDLGCYNPGSKVATPHLDALAATAVRCTDAHSPSAVCTPTRYALLTGRYAWRSRLENGVLWGTDRLLIEPGRPTIASVLAAAGYHAACFGKWHLGLGAFDPDDPGGKAAFDGGAGDGPGGAFAAGPHTVGFAESLVIPASLDIPPYVYVDDGRCEALPTDATPGSTRRWSGGGGFWRQGAMQPGFDFYGVLPRFCARAERFVRERAADPAVPWLLYLPLPAPHTPWLPTDEFQGDSGAGYYGDFVAQIDAHMGALLGALDETGQRENTLIVFTSDNGAHWRPRDVKEFAHDSHLGRRGMKADVHEAGHRVPLLVSWPGRIEPGACDALIGLQDLFATVCAAAGVAAPTGGEDSFDQLAALRGAAAGRTELVNHAMDGMFALRSKQADHDWKWIEGRGSGGFTAPRREQAPEGGTPLPSGQLYDLAADPGEQVDLVTERPDVVRRLRARLREVRAGS